MKVGPTGVFVGLYDPRHRRDAHETASKLSRVVGPSGLVWRCDGLTLAVSDPRGRPEDPLLLVDGTLRRAGATADEDLHSSVTAPELWASYRRQGETALAGLRGDYALALYEEGEGRGLLARDPLGVRPLFYSEAGGCLLFATEISPLLDALDTHPGPDQVAFAHWLGFADLSESRTLYAGVRRLSPGHAIRLEQEGWSQRPFWDWRYESPTDAPQQELGVRLVEEVKRATRINLAGAQDPGVLLSGGLDSSAVLTSTNELRSGSLRTYSAVFPDLPEMDESRLIDVQLRSLGLSGRRLEVRGGSVVRGTLEYLRDWKIPDITSNSFFFQKLLARAAQDGVDILLDGEGGDELFDTAHYLLADRLRSGQLSAVSRLLNSIPGIGRVASRRVRGELLLRFGVLGVLPARVPPPLRFLAADAEPLPGYLTSIAQRTIKERADPAAWKRRHGPRWWSFAVDTLTMGGETIGAPEHLLRLARTARLLTRHPLLDLDLTLFMLRFPPELTFHPMFTRPHLRGAMTGLVPEEVRLRHAKTYFNDLCTQAMLGPERRVVAETLLAPDALIREYARADTLHELLERPPQRPGAEWSSHLLRLFNGECWLREQAGAGFAETMLSRAALEPDQLRWSSAPV